MVQNIFSQFVNNINLFTLNFFLPIIIWNYFKLITFIKIFLSWFVLFSLTWGIYLILNHDDIL